MNAYKITFDNGSELVTSFNGSLNVAKKYYLNNTFNLGQAEHDLMTKAVKVENI